LSEIPNDAAYVRELIIREVQLDDAGIINAQIRALTEQIFRDKARLLEDEAELSYLESLRQSNRDAKTKQLEARVRLLEFAQGKQGKQVKLEHWIDSRLDVMKDCGFKSVEEAVAWIDEQKTRAVR